MLNDKINDKINDFDKKIIELIVENKHITIPELSNESSKSEATVHRLLNNLIKLGIRRVGSRKSGYWEVLK